MAEFEKLVEEALAELPREFRTGSRTSSSPSRRSRRTRTTT